MAALIVMFSGNWSRGIDEPINDRVINEFG